MKSQRHEDEKNENITSKKKKERFYFKQEMHGSCSIKYVNCQIHIWILSGVFVEKNVTAAPVFSYYIITTYLHTYSVKSASINDVKIVRVL